MTVSLFLLPPVRLLGLAQAGVCGSVCDPSGCPGPLGESRASACLRAVRRVASSSKASDASPVRAASAAASRCRAAGATRSAPARVLGARSSWERPPLAPRRPGTAASQRLVHARVALHRCVAVAIYSLSDFFMVLSSFLSLFYDDFLQCHVGFFAISYVFIDFYDFPQQPGLRSLALLDSFLME